MDMQTQVLISTIFMMVFMILTMLGILFYTMRFLNRLKLRRKLKKLDLSGDDTIVYFKGVPFAVIGRRSKEITFI